MESDLLEQYLAYLSVEKGLRPKSLEAYQGDLRHFLQYLKQKGRNPLDTGLDGLMSLFMVHLHDLGLSPRSIARKLSAIRGFYRFLLRESKIVVDPTAVLEKPKIGRPLPKVLSIQEVGIILEKPDLSKTLGIRDQAILELLYATGIRESELIDLKLGNLNRESEFLLVFGKGGKERIVPVGKFALKAVDEYLFKSRPKLIKNITERSLFINPRGQPLSRMGLWKIVRKYALLAGFSRKVSPHIFRHSCATHMLEGGASIIAVQEMLGHADISTTQIYTHLTTQELKKIHSQAHPRGK